MIAKTLTAACLLLAGSVAVAIPGNASQSLVARADANVHKINSIDSFLGNVDQTLDLARNGEYGRIKDRDLSRLDQAQLAIQALLKGLESVTDLTQEQRIELYNAQELIRSIVRDDQKARRVCKRIKATGTRLAKAECMTVAQREARARTARLNAIQMQLPSSHTQQQQPEPSLRGYQGDGGL